MSQEDDVASFIHGIPKAELHLHLEGTLEPEMMVEIAHRNQVEHGSVEELREAYRFEDLQNFLDIYYQSLKVLRRERDFYDLTWAYLKRARSENVLHTEVFFDPQVHTARGLKFETVIRGIHEALREGEERLGISTGLIMCFLRDRTVESAMETLEQALPYKDWIVAVGLDSAEVGNPPSNFQEVFESALECGFFTVAHAGEEGPPEYVWESLRLLRVSRIDHGNRAMEDDRLIQELAERRTPLTMCPLSNLKLQVISRMEDHPLKEMMERGLRVTVNSDDPAYFQGYICQNYLAVQEALQLTLGDIYQLAENSFQASFADQTRKEGWIRQLDHYVQGSLSC
ncbi:MAG: adenosine deaminase [Thermoproteota archaeon]